MPSITGGDSSARDYAPHMWVLSEGGNFHEDNDYVFVGNSTVYYRDPDTKAEYHIGVTSLGELVGQVTPDRYESVMGLPAEDIPEAAKKRLVSEGLHQIATLSGQVILGSMGIELPTNLEPIDFAKAFNGTPEEQAAEQAKRDQWEDIATQLRQTHGIE